MSERFDVVAIIGSLRKESHTRALVQSLRSIAPPTLNLSIVEIGALSMYNQDDEPTPPPAWVEFRDRVRQADAVLWATPEYNRGLPAVLKNALDIGSRPLTHNVWAAKPAAIISVSPGALGGFGANHHLRQSLVAVNMPTMAAPEAYIGNVAKAIDASGGFSNPATAALLTKFLAAFSVWIEKTRS